MGFEKGHKKLGGRQAGGKNQSTEKLRRAFADLLDGRIENLSDDLEKLSPKDRIQMIYRIADHVLPKMQAIEADLLEQKEIIITDNTQLGLP